jgi:hypothetical protein
VVHPHSYRGGDENRQWLGIGRFALMADPGAGQPASATRPVVSTPATAQASSFFGRSPLIFVRSQEAKEYGSGEATADEGDRLFSPPLCSRCSIAFSNSFW